MMLGLGLSLGLRGNAASSGAALATNIITVGDSLTYGTGSTSPGGSTSYPAYLATELGKTYNVDLHNRGVPSKSTLDLPDVTYLFDATKQNRVIVMIGTNDVLVGSDSAAVIFARLSAWVSSVEAEGGIVTVCTIPGNNVGDSGKYARMVSYNNLIRANFASVADVGADPIIGTAVNGTPLNATYFTNDNLHFTDAGNQRIAGIVAAATAPTGNAPTIKTSYGIERDSSLRLWMRDINLVGVVTGEVFEAYNIAAQGGNIQTRYLSTSDAAAVPPSRINNAVNGRPCIRLPGGLNHGQADNDAFFVSPAQTLASYISASQHTLHMVIKPITVARNDGIAWTNDGVICSSDARWSVNLKSNGKVIVATDYTYEVQTDITIGAWQILSVRMTGGQLGVRVGSSGAWTQVAAANLTDLTGALRFGTNNSTLHTGNFDVADLILRNAYDATTADADVAYLAARYGL